MVRVVRVSPVFVLRMETSADGIIAPLASSTVPTIVPVETCADAAAHVKNRKSSERTSADMAVPLLKRIIWLAFILSCEGWNDVRISRPGFVAGTLQADEVAGPGYREKFGPLR